MARKLKVYAADIDGLHEWIVAAPNQADALAAFGVHQNLFDQGRAKPTDEVAAVKTALAAPLVPLRRLKGSKAEFMPADGGGADAWEKAANAAGVKAPRKRQRPKDRSRLDYAQAALEKFEKEARTDSEALERAAEAIERRRAALRDAQADERDLLRASLDKARRSFDALG